MKPAPQAHEPAVPAGDITIAECADGWSWTWTMPCGAAQAGWAETANESEDAAVRAVEAWYRSLT